MGDLQGLDMAIGGERVDQDFALDVGPTLGDFPMDPTPMPGLDIDTQVGFSYYFR